MFPRISTILKPLSPLRQIIQLCHAAAMPQSSPVKVWDVPIDCVVTNESSTKLTLNRDAFRRNVTLLGVTIPCNVMRPAMSVLKKLSPGLVKISTVRPVDGDSKRKIVLLDPEKWSNRDALLTSDDRVALCKCDVNICEEDGSQLSRIEEHCIPVTYENYAMDFILSCVLPSEISVSGFTQVGHIVHFNLRDEVQPYKHLIGEIVLDKIPTARTVVNKEANIESTYRNFSMELLAGEPEMVTTVRENGVAFQLDFSKVYWNSRLSTEHTRIVESLRANDAVYDVFAGVGPFAVPAGKRGCRVLANDLNPDSYNWLVTNCRLNQSKRAERMGHRMAVSPYNMDGRDFIREVVIADYWKCAAEMRISQDPTVQNRRLFVVMNLPAIAEEFLDAFVELMSWNIASRGAAENGDVVRTANPPLHFRCYCFRRSVDGTFEEDPEVQFRRRLGLPEEGCVWAEGCQFRLRFVRNVAPAKDMFCAEFALTPWGSGPVDLDSVSDESPLEKRLKLSDDL